MGEACAACHGNCSSLHSTAPLTTLTLCAAHHTQFAAPGWTYVGGSGQGSLPDGTQYTTRVNTHTPGAVLEFSITMLTGSGAAASADFVIAGLNPGQALPAVLHVWQTTEAAPFVRMTDVTVNAKDGSFSVPLAASAMISVTTTQGQGAPAPVNPIPASAPFPFPWADDFESYAEGAYAKYFCDEGGVWVVQVRASPCNELALSLPLRFLCHSLQPLPNGVGNGGSALTNVITQVPIAWETNPTPTSM